MRELIVTILGCGSSSGVPKVGGDWGQCDPSEPKNRRRRSSILVEIGPADADKTTVLIDTSPDCREQLLDAGVSHIDAVLYTHDHADQTHGIDDLRHMAIRMRRRIPVYTDRPTGESLHRRFGYCFSAPKGSLYPPILDHTWIAAFEPVAVDGPGGRLDVLPFDADHGSIRSLGFRFGPVAYSPDLVGLPDESFAVLGGLECWVCDALRWDRHVSHTHVDQTLAWFERAGVRSGVMTNLHIDVDYAALKAYVPAHVEPGYDGMVLRFAVP